MKYSGWISIVLILSWFAPTLKAATPPAARVQVDDVLRAWPPKTEAIAHDILIKYGAPSEFTTERIVWHKKGPWKRIIVYRGWPANENLAGHLEQTITLHVPARKLADVMAIADRIQVEVDLGEVTVVSEREEDNILMINLVDDIHDGRRSPESASRRYDQVQREFNNGKTPSYMKKLFLD